MATFLQLGPRGINLDRVAIWRDDPLTERLTLMFAMPIGLSVGEVTEVGCLEEVFEGADRQRILTQLLH